MLFRPISPSTNFKLHPQITAFTLTPPPPSCLPSHPRGSTPSTSLTHPPQPQRGSNRLFSLGSSYCLDPRKGIRFPYTKKCKEKDGFFHCMGIFPRTCSSFLLCSTRKAYIQHGTPQPKLKQKETCLSVVACLLRIMLTSALLLLKKKQKQKKQNQKDDSF